ncbi:MAG TPA: hypothetical protein VG454_13915 [Gemmatimonadales bacterium]|nr:hypothetical protein [Gemmatimonadales bacterium]
MRRIFGLLAVLAIFGSTSLTAQESFEIEVYPYRTAHRGEWEVEGHVSYISRGTTTASGSVAPTDGQVRFAGEVTRGVTDHWEVSGYLLGAQVPDFGFEYAGWRLRSRLRAPEGWRLPVNVGLALEYETAKPTFSESARTFELTAIFERRFGDLQLIADPTFERDLEGPEHEFEFEPKARAAVDVSKRLTLGMEYYGSLGESSQTHQFYPTMDLRLPSDLSLHFGVGFGATNTGDQLVFKSRIELEF